MVNTSRRARSPLRPKAGPRGLLTFDCYGTLIDWEAGMREAVGPAVDRAFIDKYVAIEMEVEKTYRPYHEILRLALAKTLKETGVRGDERAFTQTIRRWPPFPEAKETLDRLRKDGYELAILSNVDDDTVAKSVKLIGTRFDWIVTAQQIGSYKPAPGHWKKMRELKGNLLWIAHVGASLKHDVVPATAFGLRTVWINRNGEAAGDVKPSYEFPDLRGLPDALAEST